MRIALDWKSERTAQIANFALADKAELLGPSMALALRARLRRFKTAPAVLARRSHAEVAEAVGDVVEPELTRTRP